MPINVAIVEHDQQTLNDLGRLIDSTRGFRCSGQYSSAVSALNEFPQLLPDVVLMEINLPDMNGVECVRRIRQARPRQHILVLTTRDNPQAIFKTLSAGASGYLLKNSSSSRQIITAVREVYHGRSPLAGSVARRLVNLLQQAAVPGRSCCSLSAREQQVLDLLARGFRYKEIAGELEISYATVHTHIRHIYKKLQVSCRTDAVTLYLRQHPNWNVEPRARPSNRVSLFNYADRPGNFAAASAI